MWIKIQPFKENRKKHEAKIEKYESYVKVINGLKAIIQKVESVWIKELEVKLRGFVNVSVLGIIVHLCSRGSAVKTYSKEVIVAW